MFHRVFPELKISASLLQRTYKRHGIKFKFILRGKKIIDYANPHYLNLFREMHDAVKTTRRRDIKLFWVDEAIFTFNTLSTRAWSAKHHRIQIQDADTKMKTMALIAAVSEDGGIEAYTIHEKSVTTTEFVSFVEILSARVGGSEFAIFMDNL